MGSAAIEIIPKEYQERNDPKVIPINPDIAFTAIENPIAAMRVMVTKSLYKCVKYFWSEYSQDEFVPNWHIELICHELEIVAKRVLNNEDKLYDLVINVPPGSSKTAVVLIIFPIWVWINDYTKRFITASYTSPLALESAEYSREIIRGEKFQKLFPELGIKEDKDTKSNFRVVRYEQFNKGYVPRTLSGGNRFSTSVGGSVTGFHGHFILVDDPIDPLKVLSGKEVEKANFWIDNTLPFRKVNKAVTPIIMIMQRLHQNDPTGHLLATDKERVKNGKESKIRHICIPGEITNYKEQVQPPELVEFYKDGLMDPVRLNWSVLRGYQELGNYTYGGQVGQDPVPLGGGMFEVEKLNIVERVPYEQDIAIMVRYWDKAGTEGGDGAYTAGVKMARLRNGRIIVLDVKRGRWGTAKRESIIESTAIADGATCYVYVEQEPGSGGKESAEGTIKRLVKQGVTCYADRPSGDKALRADPYSVRVNFGEVDLLYAPWNADYIDEMKHFPNSTYKDQIDASSGGHAKVVGKKIARVL
jgi:predicted phage terminase large subunit-like protein